MKISQRVSESLSGHEIRADGQTEEQCVTIGPPPTSSALNFIGRLKAVLRYGFFCFMFGAAHFLTIF